MCWTPSARGTSPGGRFWFPPEIRGFGEMGAEPPGARWIAATAASSVACISTDMQAPCVLASRRPAHPERRGPLRQTLLARRADDIQALRGLAVPACDIASPVIAGDRAVVVDDRDSVPVVLARRVVRDVPLVGERQRLALGEVNPVGAVPGHQVPGE